MSLNVGRWFFRTLDALKSPNASPRRAAAPSGEPLKLTTTRYLKLYPALGILLSLLLIPWCVHLLNNYNPAPRDYIPATNPLPGVEIARTVPAPAPPNNFFANVAIPIALFPLPMAAVLNSGFSNEMLLFCILAAFQFPIYGLFMGYGHGVDGLPSFSIGLLVAHIASIIFCAMSFL